MERRRRAPPLPLLLLTLTLLLAGLTAPPAAAAAVVASSGRTEAQLGVDYQAEILVQVNLMDTHLDDMTSKLSDVSQPTTVAPTEQAPEREEETGGDPAPQLGVLFGQDPLEQLPHGRILSKRGVQPPPPLPHMLVLKDQAAPLRADSLEACKKEDVGAALNDSSDALDRVANGELTPDTEKELEDQNRVLNTFITECSLSLMPYDDAQSLLCKIMDGVKKDVAAARAAATPVEVGLEIGSAFMVVLITLSCLMAVVAIVGLAVLAYRYTTVSSNTSTSAIKGGGGKNMKAGRARRDAGHPNPAFQPTDPPGSLHQARNDRWQQPSDVQSGQPLRPLAPPKSTWGRIWGGVVRDYQRSRDSVAEPPRRASPPLRRASPPPRRASPPPRRASPPPRRASPPPRRASPPPSRYSPPPQPEGGDNWAYGPTGRNKSTDSPFSSGW